MNCAQTLPSSTEIFAPRDELALSHAQASRDDRCGSRERRSCALAMRARRKAGDLGRRDGSRSEACVTAGSAGVVDGRPYRRRHRVGREIAPPVRATLLPSPGGGGAPQSHWPPPGSLVGAASGRRGLSSARPARGLSQEPAPGRQAALSGVAGARVRPSSSQEPRRAPQRRQECPRARVGPSSVRLLAPLVVFPFEPAWRCCKAAQLSLAWRML